MDVLTIQWGWIGGKMPGGVPPAPPQVDVASRAPDFSIVIRREKLLKEDEELIIID